MIKQLLLIGLLILSTSICLAQEHKGEYFQGFEKEISGKRFGYHSPFPDVNTSLIVRGQSDYKPISWETEKVPTSYDHDFVSFIWVFGRDVSMNTVKFHLWVNDREWFSFESSKISDLGIEQINGKDGAELHFNVTMLDKYKDQMGFAILKLPIEAIELGTPTVIKITAEESENPAWFMTFKTDLKESINIYQNKVVVKDNGELFHSISVDFIHLGKETEAKISIGDFKVNSILKAGYNKVEINLPKVETTTEFIAEIKIAKQEKVYKKFFLSPVKEWEIFLVQHTHSDIGYTRPQTEILPEHLRYIDHVLDYCDLTDDYPDAAKFRWTCETSWSVREYLKSRPQAQIDRLIKRLQEGRIEATGMFFNFSELIDESALAAQTKTLRMLKNRGVDVTTAMQNDVNGIAWCLVDYFHHTDVKYLTMGVHAHRARKPFNKPTAFWWQSPAGNRLLAYRSEHYQHGNSLSLTTGQQDVLRTNLSNYLTSLEDRNYPYDKISLQFSGYITDNSPPSTKACDIIKAWNEKYEWPKLRSALAKEFMIYLDETHADNIPVKEVAWPDWWTDGVASAANEVKVIRATHTDISTNTAILSMAKMLGADLPETTQADITEVYDNLLFYDEHTYGAAESVTDPLIQNTINQWNTKASYAWAAAVKSSMLQEKALAFLEPFIKKTKMPTIAVFNTLNWQRSGLVHLFMDYELIPEGVDFTINDVEGRRIPIEIYEQRMEGAYYALWVEDIPPMGYKTLQINIGAIQEQILINDNHSFENEYYKITFDKSKGLVSQIFDKELKQNLVDEKDTLSFGQFIYEELANRHELERLTASNRDTIYKPLDLKRSVLGNVNVKKTANGEIYKSIFLHGEMPVCTNERGVNIEIRLYHYQKRIAFIYDIIKLPVTSPESIYIAFPFKLNGGHLAYEAQGGIVYPGKNQLEGTASDWNAVQSFAAVQNDEIQIIWSSPEIPLVQFGDINIGRYYYRLHPKTNHIYSWVLNNYWVTNFKASQEGELRWSYNLSSSDNNTQMIATKFGWENKTPLLSRTISADKNTDNTKLVSRSLINLNVPNLLLVNSSVSMDGKGIVLHLREIEGDHAILDIRRLLVETKASSIQEVNILEEELSILTSPLLIEHFETKFIKLFFEE